MPITQGMPGMKHARTHLTHSAICLTVSGYNIGDDVELLSQSGHPVVNLDGSHPSGRLIKPWLGSVWMVQRHVRQTFYPHEPNRLRYWDEMDIRPIGAHYRD